MTRAPLRRRPAGPSAASVGALLLTAEQVTRHRRVCTYCTVASALTVAMVPQVLPEARVAWRALRG